MLFIQLVVTLCVIGISYSLPTTLPAITLKQLESGDRVYIETDSGREVIFHGVNAIVKGFPYIPETSHWDMDTSLSEEDHAFLEDLGVNVYRLGAMWPGVEPTRGKYNATYISEVNKIVKAASKHGIYTILDMHQDVFSEKFCGEGVPEWAAIVAVDADKKNFPAPIQDPFTDKSVADGFPTRQDCNKYNWPQYYNTYAAGSAFGSLFQNTSGLLDAWSAYWVQLAKTVGAGNPAVLGYELMNEPWGGDVISKPSLLIPGVMDRTILQPAYDKVAADIRAVDQDSLIIFAAVTWDDVVPVGFTHAPGGESEAHRSSFAFHYYNPPQFIPDLYFHQRNKDAQRLSVASFLTEFERNNDHSDDDNSDSFPRVADEADKYGLSWSMWEFKTFCSETAESAASDSQQAAFGSCKTGYGSRLYWDETGKRNDEASRKLARSYARATAGRLTHMHYDTHTADFSMVYRLNSSISKPTEIFLHQELNYPDGVEVTITPSASARWSWLSKNVIGVRATVESKDGEPISVKIQRAQQTQKKM